MGANAYYFAPGGFLYRKDPGSEEVRASSAVTSPTRPGITGPTAKPVRRLLGRAEAPAIL
jgi:hypothetical protein